jgi:hypothetical protein
MTRQTRKSLLAWNTCFCLAALVMVFTITMKRLPLANSAQDTAIRARIEASDDLGYLKRSALASYDYLLTLENLVRVLQWTATGIAACSAVMSGTTAWRLSKQPVHE